MAHEDEEPLLTEDERRAIFWLVKNHPELDIALAERRTRRMVFSFTQRVATWLTAIGAAWVLLGDAVRNFLGLK